MPSRKKPVRIVKIHKKSLIKRALLGFLLAVLACYGFIAILLVLLRWVDPPFTAVQIERRAGAWIDSAAYQKRYVFVPLEDISLHLQHAVITAEDARFFEHHGFDWKEIQNAAVEDWQDGRRRGASTITQQLVRNLFLSTSRSIVRKAIEFSFVPFAEAILSKRRILELYLNVIEWGPGVYGAEAASRYYFHERASRLSREEAVELTEILPAPLHRKPNHVSAYGTRILTRMHQMGF